MGQVKLTINGQAIEVPEGITILEAARSIDIYIPVLCSHPDLSPTEGQEAAKIIYQGDRKIENAMQEILLVKTAARVLFYQDWFVFLQFELVPFWPPCSPDLLEILCEDFIFYFLQYGQVVVHNPPQLSKMAGRGSSIHQIYHLHYAC